LLALAVNLCIALKPWDREAFFERLHQSCLTPEFRDRLQRARQIDKVDQLAGLGNGIEALESVVTAIASFALTPESFEQTIGNVIHLGGDTDTLAAMAGALSGAYLGIGGIPKRLLNLLESTPKGRDYLSKLADQLYQVHQRK
jgi:poly(ADP-ribose) glycohydrolase ARH3